MFLIAHSLHLPRQFPLCCRRIAMRLKEWNSSVAVAEGSSIIALSHLWTFLQGGCGISNTTITPSNERQEIRQEMFILTSTAAWTADHFLLWGSQRPMTRSPFQGETNPPSDKLQVFWLQSTVRPSARENHNKGDPQLPPPPLSLVHLALPRCHSAIHYLGCCCFENCIDNELRYRAIPLIIQSNITTWMKNAKAIGSIHPSSYRRFFVQPVGVVQWKRAVYKIPSINWIAKVSSWISSP